jgi:hypothetical protein
MSMYKNIYKNKFRFLGNKHATPSIQFCEISKEDSIVKAYLYTAYLQLPEWVRTFNLCFIEK